MRYETCATPYISPEPVFQRVRLDDFVGRAWLCAEIDDFFSTHDRGYFVLTSGAGLGKTSFIAHLVHVRGYLHLFVEQARGLDNLADGLRSLAAQVIRRWRLQPWFADDVLPGGAVRPHFLHRLLYVAARQRDQTNPDTPIVLAIDGVDEAGTYPGQNTLGLPEALPRGVYILITQRHASATLSTTSPTEQSHIRADDPRNLEDMRHYMEQAFARPALAHALETSDYTAEYAIQSILATCRGNWSYLSHVVEEISHQRLPLDPDALPNSLCAYYAQYWRRQRDANRALWDEVLQPLIATLSAVLESVPLHTLCALAGIRPHSPPTPAPETLRQILEQRWRKVVTVEPGVPPRYCMGETSMRDFLNGCINEVHTSQADRALAASLAAATRDAHHRIANYYLAAWGGLDAELPHLSTPRVPDPDDPNSGSDIDTDYGLRHLVAHLESAGRGDDIHRLMHAEPEPSPAPAASPPRLFEWIEQAFVRDQQAPDVPLSSAWPWYDAREQQGELADFLSDIVQAWRLVEGRTSQFVGPGDRRPPVSDRLLWLQCRYALVFSSVNNQGHNLPLPLLVALLNHNVWSPNQILTYVRQMSDEVQQRVTLVTMAPHLSEPFLVEALAIARAITDEHNRARGVAGLAPHLPEALLHEALKAARAISHPAWRTSALAGLAAYVPVQNRLSLLHEALEHIQTIWNANIRVDVLVDLAPHLPETLLPKALKIARAILDDDWRAQALIGLAPHLPGPMLRDALAMWEIWSPYWRAKVLAELAYRLGELGDVERALDIARTIANEHHLAMALAGLAPHLPSDSLADALDMALALSLEPERATALEGLAPHLRGLALNQAVAAAHELQQHESYIRVLLSLLPRLSDHDQAAMIDEACERVREIQNEAGYVAAIEKLSYGLAELGHMDKALTIVGLIESQREQVLVKTHLAPFFPPTRIPALLEQFADDEDPDQRFQGLANLAPHLNDPATLEQALRIGQSIGDGSCRARILAALAPHLPESMIETIFNEVLAIRSEKHRAAAIGDLAPTLSEALLRRALEAARAIEWGTYRWVALSGLAPYLPAALKRSLFDGVRTIGNEQARATALIKLAPALTTSGTLLRDALEAARAIEREKDRSRALAGLVPSLSDQLLQRALNATRQLKQPACRAEVLKVLAPRMAQYGYWRQAFDAAWGIEKSDDRAITLVHLAPYIPQMLLKEVLGAVRTIEAMDVRARALAGVLPYLSPEEQPYSTRDILNTALAAKWQGAASPSAIVPALPTEGDRERAFISVQMIDSPEERVRALVELVPYLPEPQQSEVLRGAVLSTRMIWGHYRAETLADIAPRVPSALLPELLSDAQSLERAEWRAIALLGMIPLLPKPLSAEIFHEPLAAVRAIWSPGERVRALVHLAPHLPQVEQHEVLAEALETAREIEPAGERASALDIVVFHLVSQPPDLLYPLWCQTLHVLATRTTRTRRDLLSDMRVLAPVVVAMGRKQALAEAARAIMQVGRWFP